MTKLKKKILNKRILKKKWYLDYLGQWRHFDLYAYKLLTIIIRHSPMVAD